MQKIRYVVLLFVSISVILYLAACKSNVENTEQRVHPQLKAVINEFSQLQSNGKGSQAIKFLNSQYPQIKNLSSLDYWYIYWNKSMYYLSNEQELDKANLYADSTTFILEQLGETRHDEFVKTYFLNGDVLLAGKKFSQAFKAYYDGRAHAAKFLNPCRLSNYTAQLGNVKLKQEKYPEAITYFKKALSENQSCVSDTTFEYRFMYTQSKINTVAVVYERMGKLDSAIHYYQQTLSFIEKSTAKNLKDSIFVQRAYGVVLGNLGGVYQQQGKFADAEKLLLKSIAINDRQDYEFQDAMTVKVKLANLYLATQREDKAYQLLTVLDADLAKIEVDRALQHSLQLNTYKLLQQYYDKTGDVNAAYNNQTKYFLLKDSLAKLNQGLKQVDMDAAFELNEQKFQTQILGQQNEIKNAYLYVFGLIAVITLSLVLFLWRDMKKSRSYIAKLKRLNLQNQQTLAALEQSQADNDKIMRIVAHDLRNPLSGITGVVTLMLEEDGFSAETKEELALIKSTGENSLALVNELLQINFNRNDLEMNEVDMGELVHYCTELLRHKAATKNQQIIAHSFTVMLTANREKIWRVLSNLIGNAIKFSPNNAVITIHMENKAEEVVVAVSDQGIGIPHQMAANLFEMFTTSKRVGTAGEESFGMGLSICKQIVEAHGGKIWFESKAGHGSTFYFSLPLIHKS